MTMTNPYASLDDVKAAARIVDTFDDALLETAIESSSRDIDAYTERVFFSTTATRVYVPEDIFVVETDDIISVTTLKTDTAGDGTFNQTFTTGDFQLEPLNGLAGGVETPATRIRAVGKFLFPVYLGRDVKANKASIQVAGEFGFASVPIAIKQATILAALRAYKRYESPTGVLGFSDMGVVRVGRMDPDVTRLIDPYRKLRMA
jgi:hypothetical protein